MQAQHGSAETAIEDVLKQAMHEHSMGRLDDARALYLQVLARQPEQADALHLLGVSEAQRGCYDLAAGLIARAIAVCPVEGMFHNNLGNVLLECGRWDDAEACYLRAIELDPDRLDALNNLGVLLSQRGQADRAERALLTVIARAPSFKDARQNLAHHYLRNGRPGDAVQQCADGLVVAPRHPALRRLMGAAYTAMGRQNEAIEVYRAWLAAEPDNVLARYHLEACTGNDVPDRAPDAYVTQVFDDFAGSFDAKLAMLSYRAPDLVGEAVAALVGEPAGTLHVLDAGCGTGLCGPLLKPYARRLVGVDLSGGMLRKALARQVYDELAQGEMVAALRARPGSYDLVVSADTLCYFGILGPFLEAARGALRDGGRLVFTVESHSDNEDAPDYRLHGHGRYSHRRGYVESALRIAGLQAVRLEAVVLREEMQRPVDGWLVAGQADSRHH